jgi:hypothetical protein
MLLKILFGATFFFMALMVLNLLKIEGIVVFLECINLYGMPFYLLC